MWLAARLVEDAFGGSGPFVLRIIGSVARWVDAGGGYYRGHDRRWSVSATPRKRAIGGLHSYTWLECHPQEQIPRVATQAAPDRDPHGPESSDS